MRTHAWNHCCRRHGRHGGRFMCACACVACAQACARDTMHRVGMRAGYSAEGPLRVRVPAGGGRTARESAARRLYASSPEIFSSGFGKADLVHAMTSGGVPGAHAITSGRTCDGWRDWRRAQTLLGSAKAGGSSTLRYPMGWMAVPSTHVAPRPPATDGLADRAMCAPCRTGHGRGGPRVLGHRYRAASSRSRSSRMRLFSSSRSRSCQR
jgi:hypothetical protein